MKPEHKEVIVEISVAVLLGLVATGGVKAYGIAIDLDEAERRLEKVEASLNAQTNLISIENCKSLTNEPIRIQFRGVEQVP